MSPIKGAQRLAACTNIPDCSKAVAGEALEWYPGAGEYCPECGEALTCGPAAPLEPVAVAERALPATAPAAAPPPVPPSPPPPPPPDILGPARRAPNKAGFANPLRWFWIVVGVIIASAGAAYAGRRIVVDRPANDAVQLCPIPSAQQLAADLARAYTVKSAAPAGRFILATSGACDVRFTNRAESPDALIARDGIVAIVNPLNPISRISENQLRAIFSGRIRDWSQLGGPSGAIVPVLPDAAADESKVLASSLFFNVPIDAAVRRGGASADVTRAVTGADTRSRRTIGIVTFSQSVPARVVTLSYLPTPNVLSIASGRYPYTLSIAVAPGPAANAAALGLIEYARSRDGAAIVLKNGLIPREGM